MIWNAAGNLLYLASQWVITVLVTVMGGLYDAGILSIAMSLSATFQTIALFGIRNYQVSDTKGRFHDSHYATLRAITCALAMVVCVLATLISGYDKSELLAVFLFMLFRLAECYSDVLHGIAQNRERLDLAGKSFAIKGVGIFLCFFLCYYFSHDLHLALLRKKPGIKLRHKILSITAISTKHGDPNINFLICLCIVPLMQLFFV
jgi:O-antigen/teichoic acid export membrane protein